jgi:spore coat polysaccharide biosynthesis protein SpsF (cytidylyltransferase family)
MCIRIRVSSILIVVVRRETDADFVCSNGRSHGFDDFEGEAAAVLDRAAVCIGAFINVVVEELLD